MKPLSPNYLEVLSSRLGPRIMAHLARNVFQRHGHLFGLLSTLLGISLQQYYLLNVGRISFHVLEISVTLIAIGILLLYKAVEHRPNIVHYALLSIYAMYFSLIIMPFVRFDALSGNDILYELMAAESTLVHGWNTPTSIQSWYVGPSYQAFLSCISVTIFPSILSEITGLDLVAIFKFCLSAIASLTPILIYINVKEIFGNRKLAILSSIIFSQFYFAFSSHNIQGARQSIAILFLLFTLLIIAKLMRAHRKKAYFPLLCLFMLSIVFNHYTTAYLSAIIFFFFIVGGCMISRVKIISNLLKVHFGKSFYNRLYPTQFVFAFFVISSLIWFLFVPSSPFSIHLRNIVTLLDPRNVPPLDIITTEYVFGSPLGPWVDNWFRFGMILSIIGFLLLASRKKNSKTFLWFIGAGVFFTLFSTTFVPNVHLLYGGFLRVYITGYFFLCTFTALALLQMDKKLKGALLIFFLLVNLPMCMLLPVNHRYVLYHPEEFVSPNAAIIRNYVTEAEFVASIWIRNYIPVGKPISTDDRSYVNMYYANCPLYRSNVESPDYFYGSKYLFLHHFAVKYGLWLQRNQIKVADTNSIITNSNVIYNNDNALLMRP